jgi:hypothetical protein
MSSNPDDSALRREKYNQISNFKFKIAVKPKNGLSD